MKINIKLGGINQILHPVEIPFISEKPIILFGCDVSHPTFNEYGKPSIAVLVGTLNHHAAEYNSTIRLQAGRTEIVIDLASMVRELLLNFYSSCGKQPQRILFYRDGVSESQFSQVLKSEVASIGAACKSLNANYNSTLTFIVVQKRHHTRFFPIKNNESDKTGNCLPGTVVDIHVTHPFEFDFYLQSHAGIKGTTRPTHYYVLFDKNNFTSDSLQQLTYNLCYSFCRATRSVSVVPQVYYADALAARSRLYYRGDWSDTDTTVSSEPNNLDTFLNMYKFPLDVLQKSIIYYI